MYTAVYCMYTAVYCMYTAVCCMYTAVCSMYTAVYQGLTFIWTVIGQMSWTTQIQQDICPESQITIGHFKLLIRATCIKWKI